MPGGQMKSVDAGSPMAEEYSNIITTIDDGTTVKLYFKPLHLYRHSGASSDIGFDIDNDRIFIRNFQTPDNIEGQYVIDAYNSRYDFQPIKINNGTNIIEFRRKGDYAKVYINGKFIRVFQNVSMIGKTPPWNLRIKAFGSRVGYWFEKK